MNASEPSCPWILQNRDNYLKRYESYIEGYRPDAQRMVAQLLPKIPIRPAIHRLLDSAYQAILDNAQKNENDRERHVEAFFNKIKRQIVTYIQKKRVQSKDVGSFAKTNAWAKAAVETQLRSEALIQATDHIEDILFLAELASNCELSPGRSHLSEELEALEKALREQYFPLLGPATRLKDILPVLHDANQLYKENRFQEVSKKIETLSSLIHSK